SPFGQTGPYRDYVGTDLTLFHAGGMGRDTPFNEVTDLEAQPPLRAGGSQAEYIAGWTAATLTMVAVEQRALTGRGQLVDLGILESVVNMMRYILADTTHGCVPPLQRQKTSFGWVMPCKDGHVSFSPFNFDHWWDAFKEMMGRPDWAESELFSTAAGRIENADAIEPLATEWLLQRTKQEVYEMALARGVPCFPVNSMAEVVGSRQFRFREYFREVEHPVAGRVVQPGPAIRFGSTPWQVRRPAPTLGQHTAEVICDELGYTRDELVMLRRTGAV
ncbi:MAG TPA: CoA transferase, partial [Dehalococcoidia bacterium]|nr:CoA transferase [Dehalococcoidia bacterium]